MHYRYLWILLGWLYVVLVLYGSLSRMPDIEVPFDHTDKLIHFLMYFILAGWFIQLYKLLSQRILILTGAIMLGIIIEFLQGMTGYRSFDLLDALANSIGAITAFLLAGTSFTVLLERFDQRVYAVLGK
jgi:VanZ family protein